MYNTMRCNKFIMRHQNSPSDVVLIGGGGSGGRFAISRLDIVRSEDTKLVCNGETRRRTETQSGISIVKIVMDIFSAIESTEVGVNPTINIHSTAWLQH